MGEVFLASTRAVSGAVRLVVIKTLRPDLVNEPGYVTRFLDEARIVIQLQHANICQVFEVGCHEGTHFFAMEHIAGTNLRRLIDATSGIIPTPLALLMMAEVLEGLDSAHRHRHSLTGEALHIVHRDMSPHNVMLSYEGDVKIIDFGLASSELKMEHTGSQVVLGKIAYMSPEQARGEPVDARSDQFSAAVVLYELLAGERYYGDRSQREIWQTAGARYVPPRLGTIEAEMAAILGRALAYEAKDRFESCGDFSQALRTVLKMRFPFAERSSLRSFVRDALVDDRQQTEESLRVYGQLALTAIPESNDPATVSGIESRSVTSSVPRGWQPAIVAAGGGLALGAVGVFLALSLMTAKDPPRPAPTAPVAAVATAPMKTPDPVTAPSPPPVSPAAADEPKRAEPEPVRSTAKKSQPVVSTSPSSSTSSASATPKARAAEAAEPSWMRWSFERKVSALDSCSAKCAKTLLRLKAGGTQLVPAAVDTCLAQCRP